MLLCHKRRSVLTAVTVGEAVLLDLKVMVVVKTGIVVVKVVVELVSTPVSTSLSTSPLTSPPMSG